LSAARILIFASGLLFGLGLGISGMTNANTVIAFLDVLGDWDPSLGFVMVGAIGVHLSLYRWILRRPSPLYAAKFRLPTATDVDARLVVGAMLFGVGWGLGGVCPGPGIVSGAALTVEALVFIAAMVGGMLVFHVAKSLVSKS
jgi:uncharacterized membrane protein YedE/YeeE